MKNPEDTSSSSNHPGQSLLKAMMEQAVRKKGHKSCGFRFKDTVLEHFSMSVWIFFQMEPL